MGINEGGIGLSRYIDAEKLKHLVNEKNYNARNKHFFFDCIIECDTEDVAPVIHAKWVPGKMSYSCSNCLYVDDFVDPSTCYCPSCGAKMDLDAIGTVEYKKGNKHEY